MKKLVAIVLIGMISTPIFAERKVIKTETVKFQTMKQCVAWLDSKFPRLGKHGDKGMPWDMLYDTPQVVTGATYVRNKTNPKLIHAVGFDCIYRRTGTEGDYFEGVYSILELKKQ